MFLSSRVTELVSKVSKRDSSTVDWSVFIAEMLATVRGVTRVEPLERPLPPCTSPPAFFSPPTAWMFLRHDPHDPAVHRLYHGSLRVCFGNVALNLKPHRSPTLQMLFYRFFVQYPFASSFCLLSTEVHSTLPRPHTLVIQARCILRPAVLFRRVGLSESHRPPSTSPPLVFHTLALSAPPYPGPPVGVRTTAPPPRAPREFL